MMKGYRRFLIYLHVMNVALIAAICGSCSRDGDGHLNKTNIAGIWLAALSELSRERDNQNILVIEETVFHNYIIDRVPKHDRFGVSDKAILSRLKFVNASSCKIVCDEALGRFKFINEAMVDDILRNNYAHTKFERECLIVSVSKPVLSTDGLSSIVSYSEREDYSNARVGLLVLERADVHQYKWKVSRKIPLNIP